MPGVIHLELGADAVSPSVVEDDGVCADGLVGEAVAVLFPDELFDKGRHLLGYHPRIVRGFGRLRDRGPAAAISPVIVRQLKGRV